MFSLKFGKEEFRFVFSNDGKTTVCSMVHKETGVPVLKAEARCNTKMDQFVKNEGRKHALARLLENGIFSRSDRTLVWKAYFGARHGKTT